jgi:tetratricopeptide (TPR) repeat protein
MPENLATKGPGFSLAQGIGNDARSALYANMPLNWNLGEIGGDDFGYDFQVTAFGHGNEGAQCAFNIQLKGTTQVESRSADGSYLSYSFKRTTLNLWHKSSFAVLVAIADLIDNRNPKTAKVYFHFANPDLDEILPGLPPDQETVTLRVPTCQEIHRDFDILPIVLPYLDEIRELRQLERERKRATGGATSETATTVNMQDSSNISSGIIFQCDDIEDLINTSSRKIELNAALMALRSGDYERVFRLVPVPSKYELEQTPQETAISAYLRSRAFDETGYSSAAEEMIKMAAALLPDNDEIASFVAQRKLDQIEFGPEGHEERQTLLKSLELRNGIGISNLKAKLYALDGDFASAREILKPFPADKVATTFVIISIVEKSWKRALSEIEESRLIPALREKQLFWLDALESKVHLELALAGVHRPVGGDFIIPYSGLPGIDYNELRRAYDTGLKAMLAGQRLNWPAAIQYVIDAFHISAFVLGYARKVFPLLTSLAFVRPNLRSIREIVVKFALQFDQPQIALELSELAGDSECFEHEQTLIAVAAYKVGNLTKALGYITDDFLENQSSADVYLSSLVMLGLASDSALRSDLLEKIRTRLEKNENSRNYLAILDSGVLVQKYPLQRHDAIQKLYEYWDAQGKSSVVGHHILINADPTDTEEATLIIDVATKLGVESSLGAEDLASFNQALLTRGDFREAIKYLKIACERFENDPRLKSLLGIALEIDGKSSEAYQLIGELLESGEASETARRYFIQIASRMGFFDQAEAQVRGALSKSISHSKRLEHLNTLFQLLLVSGKKTKNLEEVAWEYGKLANQNDEREEGFFLQQYLIATSAKELELPSERVQEFRSRLEAYNERFPKSKYLWRAEIPVGGPPETILNALKEAVGITEQDIENGLAIERKMDRGALLVPFSWRPRRFLRNISNVFMLWQFRQQVPQERAAFHFRCNINNYERHTPSDLSASRVVISLTSILLLDEIELLGLVLNSFRHIIIARSTLDIIQEARSLFIGGRENEKASRIMQELQKYFTKISHPPYPIENNQQGLPEWHYEEKMAMQGHQCVYFCDDIMETIFVCEDGINSPAKPSMTTVDFLYWADQSEGILSAHQVAKNLGLMIRLKIEMIPVQDRYVIAAIPNELQLATSKMEEEKAIDNAQTFRSILDGLWIPTKQFDELRDHFAGIMSYLLNKGNASEAVLVALWLRWLQAVRFQIKPRRTVEQKLVSGFVKTLLHLEPDKPIIHKLWQSFWEVIKRGLGEELQEPEDMTGIRAVAKFLGIIRANESTAQKAGLLFEKARLGLEQGTVMESEFSRIYVDSTAKKLIEAQKK